MNFIKTTTSGVFAGLALLASWPLFAQLGGISGPISGYHEGPSGFNCTNAACHGTGGGYTGSANFSIPATVPHGTTTTGRAFRFIVSTNAPGWGFNIAIYNPSAVKVTGNYSNQNSVVYSGFSNGELQHFNRLTTTNNPEFDFTAPDTLGTYSIYGCLNPVDGDDQGFDAGDGPSVCDADTFEVINNPPNAISNFTAITVSEDATAYSSFVNVLSNDLQTEGDAFSWFSHSIGSVQGDLNRSGGSYRYRPNGQFESLDTGEFATETFTYTIREDSYTGLTQCQGSPCRDTATVTIRVNGANDAPVAAQDGSTGFGAGHVSVDEGSVSAIIGSLLGNDSDPDTSDAGSLTTVRSGAGVPAYCSATSPAQSLAFSLNSNGTFSYTHDGTNTLSGDQTSFSYCTYDGTAYSASAALVYIDIAPSNDPPTISTSAGNTAFVEQTPIIVDNTLSLADVENNDIDRAEVTISANYVGGEDNLSCTVSTGVTCDWSTAPTLTITGTRTLAQYEAILEGVQFNSSSDNPATGNKTIDFRVRDINTAFSSPSSKILTVTRTNDSPGIAAIPDRNAFENTPADPYTHIDVAVASDPDSDDDVNDGGLGSGGIPTLTYSLIGAPPGMMIDNLNPNQGRITWDPPITGYPATVYGPITVQVVDGGENGSVAATTQFNITVRPPDNDVDMVENYNDFCPNTADISNADNDGDGTAGIDVDPNDTVGGDVCDTDDDNDGLPDTYENNNSLDPFDALDAAADNDGDGVSNLQEFLDGTNPNSFNLIIDATGYWTPFALPEPDPVSIHLLATRVTANDYGPYRPGINDITWTPSNVGDPDLATNDPGNLVSNPPIQAFRINPLVNFAASQVVEEGTLGVTVELTINGDAPAYPVTVDYSFSGSATAGADYTTPAPGGSVVFNDTTPQTITFDVAGGDGADPNETIIFTIDDATNAAIGAADSHQVTIVEGNVAPAVNLQFTQGGAMVATAYAADGNIQLDAIVNDVNAGQVHSYDWSGTDNALLPPGNVANWTIAAPAPGNYLVDVLVTDNGVPAQSTRISRILNVTAGNAPVGDYADDDDDGIPNDLDPFDSSVGTGSPNNLNLIPDQTFDPANSHIIQTDPGLKLATGNTAQAANQFGVLLTDNEIAQFGSAAGGPPLNPDDSFSHVSGIYEFSVSGLVPGASANIVIPLQTPIPRNAVYRKFNPATGWSSFVVNGANRVASAPGAPGACPEPGSPAYVTGLIYLYHCVQLTVQDGGPNDADSSANGVVSDPGSIGVRLTDPLLEEVEDGGGDMALPLITWLALLTSIAVLRRRRNRL